jgi:hypothetical protein
VRGSRWFLLALLVSSNARADPPPTDGEQARLSFEIDPLPYVFLGVDGVVGFQPASTPHFRFFVSGFSTPLPKFTLPDSGYSTRLVGGTLNGYYHPRRRARGLGFGGQTSVTVQRYEHSASPGTSAAVTSLTIDPVVGYRWFPFHHGFYLFPWARLGIAIRLDRESDIPRTDVPNPSLISPDFYIAVHLGYELEL